MVGTREGLEVAEGPAYGFSVVCMCHASVSRWQIHPEPAREQVIDRRQGHDPGMLHHKNVSMTEHYLGIQPERAQRDARLKGKRMFARPQPAGNVVPMRRKEWPSSLS